jgi:hypothetical protein
MECTELFTPIKIGKLEIKNRIGGACTTTGGADINGYITENAVATYAARAAGGAGFVCIECTFASDWGAQTTSSRVNCPERSPPRLLPFLVRHAMTMICGSCLSGGRVARPKRKRPPSHPGS